MPTAPYDSLETIANAARVRMNDAIESLGGEVFTDIAAFSLTAVNSGWRKLQDFLVSLGYYKFQKRITISGLAALSGSDPGSQVFIDWTGYNNGATLDTSKVLPQDFIFPLKVWERVSGSGASFTPMTQVLNGIEQGAKTSANVEWDWRDDKLFMPGATGAVDIQIRYASFAADFVASTTTAWAAQTVPIMRCLDALANYICAEISPPRGDQDAGAFEARGQAAALLIAGRDSLGARSMMSVSEYAKLMDRFTPAPAAETSRPT